MWKKGRQNSAYFKCTIFKSKILKADFYLLKFPLGSEIKAHLDEVNNAFEHHRLNIIIKKAKSGGEFICNNKKRKGRIQYFRPDTMLHSVTKIEEGCRYVLSIGWLKKKK